MIRPSSRARRTVLSPAIVALGCAFGAPALVHGQTLTLADAVESALESHPAIGAAVARAEGADHAADVARAARWPGAAVQGSLTRFQEPMIVAPLHAFDPTRPPIFDQTLVQGRVMARYALFDAERGGRIRARDAEGAVAREGARAAEMEVIEQVVDAYSGLLTARAVREAAGAQLTALDAELARARQSFETGSVARVEVLRATAAREEAVAAAATAEARVGLAERTLARLTGLDVARLRDALLAPLAVPDAPDPDGSGSRVGDSGSPRTAQARRALVAAEAGADEAAGARLPAIELTAGLLDYGTATGDHRAEWQAGIQVSWPVFTGGARRAGVRAARARVEASRAALAATELAVAQEIDAARTAGADAVARTDALASAVEQWAEVARIERLALAAGSGIQADLLRAEAGLFRARAALAGARHDHITARVAEARARGALDATWITRASEAGR